MKTGLPNRDDMVPALCLVGVIAMVVGGPYYALFHLSKPTVYPNPGVAAYQPPPATRLVPLPHVSDAPEIAAEPSSPSGLPATSPLTAFAQSSKEAAPPERKHARAPRADSRVIDYAPSGYAQSGYAQPGYTQTWGSSGYAQSSGGSWGGSWGGSSGNSGRGAWGGFGSARPSDNPYRGSSGGQGAAYQGSTYGGSMRPRASGGPKSPF